MDGLDGTSRKAAAWWIAAALGLVAVLGLLRDGFPGGGSTREAHGGAGSPVAARVLLPVLY